MQRVQLFKDRRNLKSQLLARQVRDCQKMSHSARALGVAVKSDGATGDTIKLSITAELRRAGQGKRLVIGEPNVSTSDVRLIDFLKEAFAARQKLLANTSETLNEITSSTTKSKGRMTALTRVSYLAPDIVNDILAGRQPTVLSVKRLVSTLQRLPLDWVRQRAFLGMN